ncbi:hypothetical protein BT96DRAFT_982159 [Gymnopus androsaceus JB14]|uniref:Uncharacterized protein n=1 Tax=Gymnopus androsaceus JB14 TaxID=1447944 RepID=A0A6A4GHD2_9AGAR|nr:hypothetical protein BT96DRAFT_982159 [Gymnopus androsaceus JB14]
MTSFFSLTLHSISQRPFQTKTIPPSIRPPCYLKYQSFPWCSTNPWPLLRERKCDQRRRTNSYATTLIVIFIIIARVKRPIKNRIIRQCVWSSSKAGM